MDQKMKFTLADCYSEISAIWLSTARIAGGKMAHISTITPTPEGDWWEAFERRCCIRAGYYARLAEQHRIVRYEKWMDASLPIPHEWPIPKKVKPNAS